MNRRYVARPPAIRNGGRYGRISGPTICSAAASAVIDVGFCTVVEKRIIVHSLKQLMLR